MLKPGTDTETVYCQIENTGVFIPEEALVHLFEAFYRVEQSVTARPVEADWVFIL